MPEPLSKILAAIHCYQVALPRVTSLLLPSALSSSSTLKTTIALPTVSRSCRSSPDSLATRYPLYVFLVRCIESLQPQGQAFEPSTGKLATMSPEMLVQLYLHTHHQAAAQLESMRHLRTVAVLQFALPMQINTEREVKRLAKHSSLSIFTRVDGGSHE